MQKIHLLEIVFLSFLISGCASQRGWRYAPESPRSRAPLVDKSVAVPPFTDARPDKNENALLMYLIPIVPFGWCDYSIPESGNMKLNSIPVWQFRPTEDLAKAAADELRASGLFGEVFFTNRPSEADLVFSGTINSLRYSGTMLSYGLSVYGPLLWFFGFPCGTIRNELAVDLKLHDEKQDLTLWANSYKLNYDKVPVWIYSLPNDFAYDALYKRIMLESIKDMERRLSSYRDVRPVEESPIREETVKQAEETTKEIEEKFQPQQRVEMQTKTGSYAEYYRLLYKTISSKVVKPAGSGSGTVNAAFTLSADGALEDVQILEGSSEDATLKDAVVKAIKDSAPYPPFPDDIKAEGRKTFTITIEFKYR